MTVSLSGYPDFQTTPQWRGPLNPTVTKIINSTTPAVYDELVSNFASLFFKVVQVGAGCQVNLTYYLDSSKAITLGAYYWAIRNPNYLSVIVPNLGNFAEAVISTSLVPNQSVTTLMQPCNIPVPKPFYPETQNYVHDTGSVAAGATNFYNMPQIMEGSGVYIIEPGDAAGKLDYSMYEVSLDNTFRNNILAYIAPTAQVVQPFQSSVYPVTLKIVNNDGVAGHPFTIRVQVQSV